MGKDLYSLLSSKTFIRIKTFLVVLLVCAAGSSSRAQKMSYNGFPSLIWPRLYDITFTTVRDAKGEYEKPIFSQQSRALNGKKITLPGYMVPFETGSRSTHFMISSLPLNACFFCGIGGQETAVEVYSKQPVSYTDKPVEVEGVLKLNDSNPDQLVYILESATVKLLVED